MTDQIRRQSQLEMVSSQIQFVRTYTEQLLADIDQESWYEQPIDGMNHIAWQVGHLTMAQYGLALLRQRGRESADRELIPRSYLRMFAKGSSPSIDVDARPDPAEIRSVFDRVHQQVLKELEAYPLEQLDTPVELPYVAFPNKLGSLIMSAHHEMLHAGQIGMLRRLLGKPPIER
jgi:hypothetical protein